MSSEECYVPRRQSDHLSILSEYVAVQSAATAAWEQLDTDHGDQSAEALQLRAIGLGVEASVKMLQYLCLKSNGLEDGTPMTLGQAATELNVDPMTLRRWADEGVIDHFRTPGGHRRFRTDDVRRIRERREGQ